MLELGDPRAFEALREELERARRESLPDPELTPGEVCEEVVERLAEKGFVERKRRPPFVMRERAFAHYGIALGQRYQYVIDHLIPFSLGGAHTLKNMWPHRITAAYGPYMKSRLENSLRRMVRQGVMALRLAQELLASDWVAAYTAFFGPSPVVLERVSGVLEC